MESVARGKKDIKEGRIISLEKYEEKYIKKQVLRCTRYFYQKKQ